MWGGDDEARGGAAAATRLGEVRRWRQGSGMCGGGDEDRRGAVAAATRLGSAKGRRRVLVRFGEEAVAATRLSSAEGRRRRLGSGRCGGD